MLKDMAKDFYKKQYAMPPGPTELAEFAELVLKKFIKELEDNSQGVAWNYGFDGVIFTNRDREKKSLKTIKEEYLVNRNDQSNTVDTDGRGIEGDKLQDKTSN